MYRGTSLVRKRTPVGPYRRPTPRVQGGLRGVGIFLWARYSCRLLRDRLFGSRIPKAHIYPRLEKRVLHNPLNLKSPTWPHPFRHKKAAGHGAPGCLAT